MFYKKLLCNCICVNVNLFCFNRIKLGSNRTVTVVQCHPYCNTLSIGDNTGRIVLYYNIMHKSTRSQTVYHWHTLPVNDVVFTSTGMIFKNCPIVILLYLLY